MRIHAQNATPGPAQLSRLTPYRRHLRIIKLPKISLYPVYILFGNTCYPLWKLLTFEMVACLTYWHAVCCCRATVPADGNKVIENFIRSRLAIGTSKTEVFQRSNPLLWGQCRRKIMFHGSPYLGLHLVGFYLFSVPATIAKGMCNKHVGCKDSRTAFASNLVTSYGFLPAGSTTKIIGFHLSQLLKRERGKTPIADSKVYVRFGYHLFSLPKCGCQCRDFCPIAVIICQSQ
jgi:hypothetical protein